MLKVGIIKCFSLSWVKHHSFNSQYFLNNIHVIVLSALKEGVNNNFSWAYKLGGNNSPFISTRIQVKFAQLWQRISCQVSEVIHKTNSQKAMQQSIKAEVVVWQLYDTSVTPAQNQRNLSSSHHTSHQFSSHMMEPWGKTVVQIYFPLLLLQKCQTGNRFGVRFFWVDVGPSDQNNKNITKSLAPYILSL